MEEFYKNHAKHGVFMRINLCLALSAMIISFLTLSCTGGKKPVTEKSSRTNVHFGLETSWKGSNGEMVLGTQYLDGRLYAYAGYDGLIGFTLPDGTNLSVSGRWSTNLQALNVALQKYGSNTYALVLLSRPDNTGGVAILDVTDPTNFVLLAMSNMYSNISGSGFYAGKNRIYFGNSQRGLTVLSYTLTNGIMKSEPFNSVGGFNLSGLTVDEGRNAAYLAAENQGLLVVHTRSGKVLSQQKISISLANSVAIDNDMLAVGDGMSGVFLYDIRNPSMPRMRGFYSTVGETLELSLVKNELYIADGCNGTVWLGINNTLAPTNKAQYMETGITYGVTYGRNNSGRFLFSSMGQGGIRVIRLPDRQ